MVTARLLDGDQLECRVVSTAGTELVLTGTPRDIEPHREGTGTLRDNRALVSNAWSYAKFMNDSVRLSTTTEQKYAGKRAAAHRREAQWIAGLVDHQTNVMLSGWCSACYVQTDHQKVDLPVGRAPAYLCGDCGSPTLPCAAPRCKNMAIRGRGPARAPRFCAEHRHDIPGFETAASRLESLDAWSAFLKYERQNLKRGVRIAGIGATTLTGTAGVAWFGAAAIGGAIGSVLGGYTGAAATSYGLALLGGGSVAAGGLGIAGGTVVVTALGGALGGVLGASVANSYLQEDKSFHIERLKDGPGVPVVVCNGFLSDSGSGWGEWEGIVTSRYPDSPVYRVHWGAKELSDLGLLFSANALKTASKSVIRKAAEKATRQGAKKLGPLTPLLVASGLAKNPWSVAKNRAEKTGVLVADLLARTNVDSYVLVGHSLGARAMVVATQTLGSKVDGPKVREVHLLGAAIGAKGDWHTLSEGAVEAVYNYFSVNDRVLKYIYRTVQAGQTAAGCAGFAPETGRVRNLDVSEAVSTHSDYHYNVTLR